MKSSPKGLAGWDRKAVSDWWQRSVDKERARMTNAPKSASGDRFSTPEDYRHFAPPLKPLRKSHAR